jgi:glucose/arabinose dehydrogenase
MRKSFLHLLLPVMMIAAFTAQVHAQPVVVQDDVPAQVGFRKDLLVTGLEHPWGMAFLPNGDLLITERPGRLRLVRGDRLLADPVAGVPAVFASGQGGLLDICLHPRFAENRKVYFTYAHGTSKANRTRVAAAAFDGKRLENWKVVFEVAVSKSGSQHFGSRLLWMPDETLLVSIGDGGNPPVRYAGDWIRVQAQNRDIHLGKILRLNPDGTAPSDNPFIGEADAEPAVWSYGHRNIQGLAYDPLRAAVWASEHGALGGDELNAIEGGKNYGWPEATYSREYVLGTRISPDTTKAGMVDPVVVWMTAIAPSGLMVYTGDRFAEWKGDVFAGGLKSQDIRRIDLDSAGRVLGQFALRIGERVRDVCQGPDGLIYVITDESKGSLYRLAPAGDRTWPDAP